MVFAFALRFDDHERFGHACCPTVGLVGWDRPSSVVGDERSVWYAVSAPGQCTCGRSLTPASAVNSGSFRRRGGRAVYPAPSVHLLSTISALSLDPKEILNDLSPYGEIGLMLIIFAETGLLIGFFLPGDSLLFTAGILANQGKLNLAAVLVGCFAAAVIGDQVGLHHRPEGRPAPVAASRTRGSSNRSTSTAPRTSSSSTAPKTIVMARFVPIVRTFAPVVAGDRQDVAPDVRQLTTSSARFVWVFGVTLAGYCAGRRHRRLDRQVPAADHRGDHHHLADPAVPRVAQGEEAEAGPLHPGPGRSRSRRPPRSRRRRLTPSSVEQGCVT